MASRISEILRYFSTAGACLALALAGAGTARALDPSKKLTQYVHRTWQTPEGLSQTSVYSVTQTRDGYLWVGTQSGVLRFDGVEFNPVRALQSNSLGDVWARSMMEDGGGRLWILTNDFQLIRITGNKVKVFSEEDGLPTQYFSCLVRGAGDDVWACTPTGLVRFLGDKFEVHESPAQIGRRPDTGCRASDGKIWMAGGDLLTIWDGSQFSKVALKSPGNREMRALLCTPNEVWIGTGKGLIRYTAGGEKFCPWLPAATVRYGWARAMGLAAYGRDRSKPTITAMVSPKIRSIGFSKIVKGVCGSRRKMALTSSWRVPLHATAAQKGCPAIIQGQYSRTTKAPYGRVRWMAD